MTKHKFYEAASTLLDRYSTPLEKDTLKDFKVEILKLLPLCFIAKGEGFIHSLHQHTTIDINNLPCNI